MIPMMPRVKESKVLNRGKIAVIPFLFPISIRILIVVF